MRSGAALSRGPTLPEAFGVPGSAWLPDRFGRLLECAEPINLPDCISGSRAVGPEGAFGEAPEEGNLLSPEKADGCFDIGAADYESRL